MLAYFTPRFTLGLTATPERADDQDILEIFKNILMNPFKHFEDMQMMRHTKTLGIVEVDSSVWKRLTDDEKAEIRGICEDKVEEYYRRLGAKS